MLKIHGPAFGQPFGTTVRKREAITGESIRTTVPIHTPALGTVSHIRFSGSLGAHQAPVQGVSLYFSGAQRKIMSYNAENFYRTTRNKHVKDKKSIEALAKVILDEDPDVIAFQEVGDRATLQNFNYQHLKGRYPKIVIFNTFKGSNLRVAMMAKKDIRVVDAKSHYKSQCGGGEDCGKRDFLEATFETETGYRFTVFDAHFKSMKGGEQATMPIRLDEATKAAKIIRRHLERDPQARLVVAGDINVHHESPYGRPVIQALTLADDDDPANDLAEVMLKDGRNEPTHNGKGYYPNSKLDYTFVSPAMLKDVVKAYVAGKFTAPWTRASDHLPLVTVIEEPDDLPKPQRRPETQEARQYRKYRKLDLTA